MTRLVNDIRTRLYLNDDWRDISTSLRYEAGVTIRRGYGPEDEVAPPSTCKFTLNNTSGDYTERNPLSPWYGYLGRSTPVELACRMAKDTMSATVSNGWGTTEAHANGAFPAYTWTTPGTASNYAKASGKATHLITAANNTRTSYLADLLARDLDLTYTVALNVTNITGAAVAIDTLVHGQGALTDFYVVRLYIETDETLSTDFLDAAGNTLTGGSIPVGLTHTSSQTLRVRVQAEGTTLRIKVWPATSGEPYDWTDSYTDQGDDSATEDIRLVEGWVGVRSATLTGNTNASITWSYDEFEFFCPEFSGEIAAWPRRRDVTGNDRTITVTAADVTRRLGAGESPLNSAMRRYMLGNRSGFISQQTYWPLEDGQFSDADQIQPALGGGYLGFVLPTGGSLVGRITWAEDNSMLGGLQAPGLTGGGSLVGYLNPATSVDGWAVHWCMKQAYSDGAEMLFATAFTHITLTPARGANSLTLTVQESINGGAASPVLVHNFADKADVEKWHHFAVEAIQIGADYAYFFWVDGEMVDSHTQSPGTLEGMRKLQFATNIAATSETYYGHITAFTGPAGNVPAPEQFYDPFTGYLGEEALIRAQRLCEEESVEFDWIGSGVGGTPTDGELMGAQRADKLLELIQACAKVDNGLLYSQRSLNGLQFRTLRSMYARSAWVTLSLSAGHFSPPWDATSDDQALRNDITASRDGGGTVRVQLDDGSRMSVTSAAEGGAGRYDSSVGVNVASDTQLTAQAAWRVHLGTADEDRFPSLRLELARAVFRDTAGLVLARKLRQVDIGEAITLTGMQTEDLYDDLDEVVVGVLKRFDQITYDVTLTCRPGSRYQTGEIGNGWRLTSDTTTTSEALDASETGVDVAVTGALWTAADVPFDIMIGGERMTVTNVTGASSPQTFTVTRNVNGLPGGKTHSTGAAVTLADPNYLGK